MKQCPNCLGGGSNPATPKGEKARRCYYCDGDGLVPDGHETLETWPLLRRSRPATPQNEG